MERQQTLFLSLLKEELIPSLGCTEPISIAYTAALARRLLGREPDRLEVLCSGNVIKNVKAVTVPNSGGLKGIAAAAILGALGGDPDRELEVLSPVTDDHRARTRALLSTGFCHCGHLESESTLDILVIAAREDHTATVRVRDHHTHIVAMEKDGKNVLPHHPEVRTQAPEEPRWSLDAILDFAETVDADSLRPILARQVEMNCAIADEGLRKPYGAGVGPLLLQNRQADVATLARARAAAGSDARMSGCAMPVVINSGSGNQGLTVCLPVETYARALWVGEEKTLRALALSNLVAMYQKRQIGCLSAYCGAVCAACGSGAAITWLHGGSREAIGKTVVNTMAVVGGMLCDGAKPSCAGKIAACVEAAILGHRMAMAGTGYGPGEGLVKATADETIRCYGTVAREGMQETDRVILAKMLEDD